MATRKEQEPVVVTVLSQERYRQLEEEALAGFRIDNTTSPIEAGALAGVHQLLKLIRDKFVQA